VRPLDFPILADENIDPEVVAALRAQGKGVTAAPQVGLAGATDEAVLSWAHAEGRVVLTHDRDFGRLALHRGRPYVGVVHLRPGHIAPTFVLEMIATIESATVDVAPPFLVVAERRGDTVRLRVRPGPAAAGNS